MRPGTDPFEGLVEGAQRAATAAGIAPEMMFALGDGDPHARPRLDPRRAAPVRPARRLPAPGRRPVRGAVDAHHRRHEAPRLPRRPPRPGAPKATSPAASSAPCAATTTTCTPTTSACATASPPTAMPAASSSAPWRPRACATSSRSRCCWPARARPAPRPWPTRWSRTSPASPATSLWSRWRCTRAGSARHESGGDLALAYQRLDRLEGALARAAEEVFWNPSSDPKKLTEAERPMAEALFMRLVRAGDAGGATRRPVAFAELEEPARAVARKLATQECRRLLVLREPDGGTGGGRGRDHGRAGARAAGDAVAGLPLLAARHRHQPP